MFVKLVDTAGFMMGMSDSKGEYVTAARFSLPTQLKDTVQTVTEHNRRRRISPLFANLPKDSNSAIAALCEMKQNETDPEKCREIINEIVLRVFFLLPHHAKKHAGKLFMRLPHSVFEDAVQNMSLNVLTAIAKFDPSRGTKFSNYLLMYLRDGLYKAIKQCNVITPSAVREKTADLLEFSDEDDDGMERHDSLTKYNNNVVPGAINVVRGQVEFDDGTVAGVDGSYLTDTPDSINSLYIDEVNAWLRFALDPENGVLTEDEAVTLRHHFGVFGCAKLRLKDIADMRKAKGKGHAATRIFQIEKEAIRKLRAYFDEVGLDYDFAS